MLGSEKEEYKIGIENWGFFMVDKTEYCNICGVEFLQKNMMMYSGGKWSCSDCRNDAVSKFLLSLEEFSENEIELLKEINWDGELL